MKSFIWGREVAATYLKEFRCLVRDQHTIIYSVLIPVFLYPALVWGIIQIMTYAQAIQDREVSEVRLVGAEAFPNLKKHLEDTPKLRLLEGGTEEGEASGNARNMAAVSGGSGGSDRHAEALVEAARADLSAETTADAWLLVKKRDPGRVEVGPERHAAIELVIVYNSALDGSAKAHERLDEAIDKFRDDRLIAAANLIGESEEFLTPLVVTEEDIVSPAEFSKYMASLILPLLMLIMTALGALYPSLDVTVGERERGCLETTLLSPVGRASIVVGKYLAVVCFALTAFLLNFVSMGFTLFHQGSVLQLEMFEISWSTIGIILIAALLLSAFFSALMMLLAFQARTFKEGQSYVMPVYLLAVLPTLAVANPDASCTAGTAWIPVVNIALLFRGALQGNLTLDVAVVTLLVAVLYAVLVLIFAVWCLQRREVVDENARLFSFWLQRRVSG